MVSDAQPAGDPAGAPEPGVLAQLRAVPGHTYRVFLICLVGVTFAIAPFVLGFSGIDAWYYWANAAAVLTVVSLSRPEDLSLRRVAHA